MPKLQKLAIAAMSVMALSFFGCTFRSGNTGIIQAPGMPDLNTDAWEVRGIYFSDTLSVKRNGEQRRVKLCGIEPATQSTETIERLIQESNAVVEIAFLGQQPDETWGAEVWVNAGTETEELLNGLLILHGAATANKQQWTSCPNKDSLQIAEEIFNEKQAK